MAEPVIVIISSDSENEVINDSVIVISSDSEGELVPGQFSDAESTGWGEIAEFERLGDGAAVEGVATLDEDEYEGEGSAGTEWDGSGWEADWEDWEDWSDGEELEEEEENEDGLVEREEEPSQGVEERQLEGNVFRWVPWHRKRKRGEGDESD